MFCEAGGRGIIATYILEENTRGYYDLVASVARACFIAGNKERQRGTITSIFFAISLCCGHSELVESSLFESVVTPSNLFQCAKQKRVVECPLSRLKDNTSSAPRPWIMAIEIPDTTSYHKTHL